MNMRATTLSSITLAGAIVLLSAAAAFALSIRGQWGERLLQANEREEQAQSESSAARASALARDTKDIRESLDALANVDVLSAADSIESVGRAVGVTLKIDAALAGNGSNKSAASGLRAVNFVVEAEGPFPALMHAARLLESLPLLSSVKTLEFEQVQDSGSGAARSKANLWRMNAVLEVLTSDVDRVESMRHNLIGFRAGHVWPKADFVEPTAEELETNRFTSADMPSP